MTIPEWTFGDRLRKARRLAGLSQDELADAVDVHARRLAAWESGYANPRGGELIEIASAVAQATNVPVTWLLGLDDTAAAGHNPLLLSPALPFPPAA